MKKVTSIVLDEDLLYKAKKEIPNLSGFFEKCLTAYFEETGDIQNELNKIKESKVNIRIMMEKEKTDKLFKNQLNKTWTKIWRHYRQVMEYPTKEIQEFSELINKTPEIIEDVLNQCLIEYPNYTDEEIENWDFCYKEFKK